MKDFVTSSALTRLLANIFIFLVVVASLVIACIEILQNQPIQPIVYIVVSSALTYATTIIGVHIPAFSSIQQESKPPPSETTSTDTVTTTEVKV